VHDNQSMKTGCCHSAVCSLTTTGAFCTQRFVVGTGAYVRPKLAGGVDNPESGSYAHFYVSF
jgi:hypothetical protein